MSEESESPQRKLERFEDLARRLLHVPKREVDEAREAEKEAREKPATPSP